MRTPPVRSSRKRMLSPYSNQNLTSCRRQDQLAPASQHPNMPLPVNDKQNESFCQRQCPVNQNPMPPPSASLCDTRLQQQAAHYRLPPSAKLPPQTPSSTFPSQREEPSAVQSPPPFCEPSRGPLPTPFHSQVVAISALRSTCP